jgi:hypothetical protein
LKFCYYLSGKSFAGFEQYENVPLQRFHKMLAIHLEAVEIEKKAWEK